eukprot:Tamp_31567.p2 GENE.Tamp_31567~~Tamp_31567.p2  ORF type:complete len:225 (+),score=79.46 Tamp_31567:54-677(+)
MSEKVKREEDDAPEPEAKKAKREDSDDEVPLKAKSTGKAKATVSSCVLVTGTEYKDVDLREKLKALGASWCKPLTGWVLPESARGAVEKVIGGGELSPAEVAASGSASADKDPEPSKEAAATVCVAPHKKAILVTGETMKVKDVLKAIGGKFNKPLSGWIFPGSKREQVLRVLRADATNTVQEGTAGAAAKKKKSADDEFINDDESD